MVRFLLMTILLSLLTLTGCGRTAPQRPVVTPGGLPTLEELALLGAGAGLEEEARSVSVIMTRPGADYLASGGNIMAMPPQVQLNGSAEQLSWVIYRFTADAERIVHYIEIEAQEGSDYYVAISDFSVMRWRHLGAHESNSTHALADAPGTFSSGSAVYVAVLAWGEQQALIDGVRLAIAGLPPIEPAHSYGLSGTQSFIEDCTPDGVSGIVACGGSDGVTYGDALLLRVGADGQPIWSRSFDGEHPSYAWSVSRDYHNDRYVAACSTYPDTFVERGGVISVSATGGGLAWSRRFNTDNNLTLRAVDTWLAGVTYVAGNLNQNAGEGFVAMLDGSNGELVWAVSIAGAGPGQGLRVSDVIARSTGIFLACIVENGLHDDCVLLKLHPGNGSLLWGKQWGHEENGGYFTAAMHADPAGVLIGASFASDQTGGYRLMRFNSEGGLQQEILYNNSLHGLRDVQTDLEGNIYLLLLGEDGNSKLARLIFGGLHIHTLAVLNGADPPSASPYNLTAMCVNPFGTVWLTGYGSGNVSGSHWEETGGVSDLDLSTVPSSFAGTVSPFSTTLIPMLGTMEGAALTLDDGGVDHDAIVIRSDFGDG